MRTFLCQQESGADRLATAWAGTPRILIVEDDAIIATEMQAILEGCGCLIVGVADSALDAVGLAEANRPDLVVSDINLRGTVDGIELAQQLRGQFGLPTLFVTGSKEAAVTSRAMAANPAGFLRKPFASVELEVVVKTALVMLKVREKVLPV